MRPKKPQRRNDKEGTNKKRKKHTQKEQRRTPSVRGRETSFFTSFQIPTRPSSQNLPCFQSFFPVWRREGHTVSTRLVGFLFRLRSTRFRCFCLFFFFFVLLSFFSPFCPQPLSWPVFSRIGQWVENGKCFFGARLVMAEGGFMS